MALPQQQPNLSSPMFGAEPIALNTYKEQAYRLIKDAILYRKMKVGVVYSQDGICADMQISRTPVREALLELQQEGYVTILRGRGISVVPMGEKEARDIIEMRHYMETLGSFLAAQRRNKEQLLGLRGALEEMRSSAGTSEHALFYRLDRTFHYQIFQAAGNAWLQRTNEQLRDHFLRVENQEAFELGPVLAEHEAVCLAIEAGDADQASQAMRLHMEKSMHRTMRHIVEQSAPPLPLTR